MKKVFESILASDDIQEVKNCVAIMAESCEIGMNNGTMLEMLKQLKGEIDSCHYDEETADLHLCLIEQLHAKDIAKDYWHQMSNFDINEQDWCVLWGEMTNLHTEKIRKWFPGISQIDLERKIFDECVSFLKKGKLPYYDLKV